MYTQWRWWVVMFHWGGARGFGSCVSVGVSCVSPHIVVDDSQADLQYCLH